MNNFEKKLLLQLGDIFELFLFGLKKIKDLDLGAVNLVKTLGSVNLTLALVRRKVDLSAGALVVEGGMNACVHTCWFEGE